MIIKADLDQNYVARVSRDLPVINRRSMTSLTASFLCKAPPDAHTRDKARKLRDAGVVEISVLGQQQILCRRCGGIVRYQCISRQSVPDEKKEWIAVCTGGYDFDGCWVHDEDNDHWSPYVIWKFTGIPQPMRPPRVSKNRWSTDVTWKNKKTHPYVESPSLRRLDRENLQPLTIFTDEEDFND